MPEGTNPWLYPGLIKAYGAMRKIKPRVGKFNLNDVMKITPVFLVLLDGININDIWISYKTTEKIYRLEPINVHCETL